MDALMIAAYVVVSGLLVAGLAGTVLPFLPGTLLIFAGAFLYALVTDFTLIGAGRLLILAGLTVLAHLLDYAAGALGARRFGGSGWAVAGALVGGLVGIFFGPLGLLVGPVVGAVAGEWLKSGDVDHSLHAGVGALVGMVLALLARFTLAITMVGLFLWWLWRG